MDSIMVFSEGVIKLLKGLNPSKALGSDELYLTVLKVLANEQSTVFAHFDRSTQYFSISCFAKIDFLMHLALLLVNTFTNKIL